MKWTTGLARHPQASQAFAEAVDRLDLDTEGRADVLVIFFTHTHRDEVDALARAAAERFPEAVCIGCSAAGVVADEEQAEQECAVSLSLGVAPGVDVAPVRLEPDIHDREDFDWQQHSPLGEMSEPHMLVLSDVRTFDSEQLLRALDERHPDGERFGALVGGSRDDDLLLLEGHVFEDGGVGLALSGDLEVDTYVAQPARPIGEPLIVTSHTEHVVHRFDQGNPMEVFRRTVRQLGPEDQKLAKHSMLVGIGLGTQNREFGHGDFLLRNIAGFNPKNGDLAVAATIEDLDVLQFHLMSPQTAIDELEKSLEECRRAHPESNGEQGALYFSCRERGEEFYGEQNLEPNLIQDHLEGLSVGGCLSDGDIGALGEHTHLHGYASTLTVIGPGGDSD
ncbi:MAG: FIST signal transduction protein [Persicimonas sp.]